MQNITVILYVTCHLSEKCRLQLCAFLTSHSQKKAYSFMFLRQILSCYNLKTSFAKLVKVLVLELFYGTRTRVHFSISVLVLEVFLRYSYSEVKYSTPSLLFSTGNRNDRRSRRVFFCFYSAIFQLTSAKFQTFAYNSRTVGSSCMKFGQQFEINELYVCTKFRGNRSRDFGFRTPKPPRKFGVKSGLSQKRLKYGKKYFIGLYVSR